MEVREKDINPTKKMRVADKDSRCKQIKRWFDIFSTGRRAVVYISGTYESAVCAALLTEALGRDAVVGIVTPNLKLQHANQIRMLIEHLGIESYVVPISIAVASLQNQMEYEGIPISHEAACDLPDRVRKSVLYAIAKSINGEVIDEHFLSIMNLSEEEMLLLGRELHLPEKLICEWE